MNAASLTNYYAACLDAVCAQATRASSASRTTPPPPHHLAWPERNQRPLARMGGADDDDDDDLHAGVSASGRAKRSGQRPVEAENASLLD